MYRPMEIRGRLHTGGKTVGQIRECYTGQGLTYRGFESLQRAFDLFDGQEINLFKRERGVDTNGQKYIVAKNGMEIAAVIMPLDTIKLGVVEKLEALAHKCRVAVEAQEEREREKAMRRVVGPLLQEGGDTGEGAGE